MTAEMIALAPIHAELAAAIHRQCFERPWGATAMAEMLAMPGAFGWIAGAGRPVGLVLCRIAADEAEVVSLCVLPEERRGGHAGRLLDAALAGAAERGAGAMFLEVGEDNAPARRLYQTRGFTPAGRRPHYYGPGAHALILRRALAG